MLSSRIVPMSKCIITDYLPTEKFNNYTSGYLIGIEGAQNDTYIVCTMLITNIGGKILHKPQIQKIRTPPVFCPELAQIGVYGKCSGFLLVDPGKFSYLDAEDGDFINMIYARIQCLNRIGNSIFHTNTLINTSPVIKKFVSEYNGANKVQSKDMMAKVHTTEQRNALIEGTFIMESFVRRRLPVPIDLLSFLKRAYSLAKDYDQKALAKTLSAIVSDKNYNDLMMNSQENKDALHRYKNSGYWV